MNWLDLRLSVEERLKIDMAAHELKTKSPDEIVEIFSSLMASNALQQKAIKQMTSQILKYESK